MRDWRNHKYSVKYSLYDYLGSRLRLSTLNLKQFFVIRDGSWRCLTLSPSNTQNSTPTYSTAQTPPSRLRIIQIRISAEKVLLVSAVSCLLKSPDTHLSISLVVISHEGKASATAGASLHREINVAHVSILLKQRQQVLGLD